MVQSIPDHLELTLDFEGELVAGCSTPPRQQPPREGVLVAQQEWDILNRVRPRLRRAEIGPKLLPWEVRANLHHRAHHLDPLLLGDNASPTICCEFCTGPA